MRRLLLAALLAAACRAPRAAPRPPEPRAPARCAALDPAAAIVRDPRPPPPAGAPVVVAVMGGPHGDPAPPPWLARGLAGARVVAVVGGLEGDADALGRWLDAVLPADAPALLVPADTEDVAAFRAAVAALRRARPALHDGTAVRLLVTAGVELVTVPGGAWPRYLPPGGCALSDDDARALPDALPRPAAPRVVVAASAPRQAGVRAIDRGVLGAHVGSDALAAALPRLGARGVVALLPRESAGTLGDLAGAALAHDTGTTPFALSLGRAGADPVETVAGALAGPMAWRLTVSAETVRVARVGP